MGTFLKDLGNAAAQGALSGAASAGGALATPFKAFAVGKNAVQGVQKGLHNFEQANNRENHFREKRHAKTQANINKQNKLQARKKAIAQKAANNFAKKVPISPKPLVGKPFDPQPAIKSFKNKMRKQKPGSAAISLEAKVKQALGMKS